MRCVPVMIAMAVLLLLGPSVSAVRAAPPAEAPVTTLTVPEPILKRLRALDPSRPADYFVLGEDVADLYQTPADRELAQQLFVLAFEIDRRQGGTAHLAGSACMALADLAALERDRKWLWALARAVDPRFERTGWDPRLVVASVTDAYRSATALGLVRSGDGIAAQQLLKEPGVRQTIQHYERLLSETGDTGGLYRLETEAQRWPCPECANGRIVKKFGTNPPEYRLCTNCGGHPGPKLTLGQLVAQLRFESRLLRGIQRSWSAQIAADGGEPLKDPEVSELAAVFGVDPAASLWRDGAWVKAPGQEKQAPAKQAPPPPASEKQPPEKQAPEPQGPGK